LPENTGPAPPSDLDGAVVSTTTLHPDAVAWDDYDATFAVGLRLPDVTVAFVDVDDSSDDFTFWAHSGHSWASVEVAAGDERHRVRQHGRRLLWDEITDAYHWWQQAGRPPTEGSGSAPVCATSTCGWTPQTTQSSRKGSRGACGRSGGR